MLFVFISHYGVQHDFHSRWCSCRLILNTTGVTCGAGTDNPSGPHELNPGFVRVRVALS